ncbi:MAG: hypothetical protein GY737_06840 [Desulfobacteraceae bacterium]|nr:hypothetical protein [Desulfobacteraceae bacterium]
MQDQGSADVSSDTVILDEDDAEMDEQETLGEVTGQDPSEYPDESSTSTQGKFSKSADEVQILDGLYSNPFHVVIDVIDVDDD